MSMQLRLDAQYMFGCSWHMTNAGAAGVPEAADGAVRPDLRSPARDMRQPGTLLEVLYINMLC